MSTGDALAAAWCNLPLASAIAINDLPLLVLIDMQPFVLACRVSALASHDAFLSVLWFEEDRNRRGSLLVNPNNNTRCVICPAPSGGERGTGSCSRGNHDHVPVFCPHFTSGLLLCSQPRNHSLPTALLSYTLPSIQTIGTLPAVPAIT